MAADIQKPIQRRYLVMSNSSESPKSPTQESQEHSSLPPLDPRNPPNEAKLENEDAQNISDPINPENSEKDDDKDNGVEVRDSESTPMNLSPAIPRYQPKYSDSDCLDHKNDEEGIIKKHETSSAAFEKDNDNNIHIVEESLTSSGPQYKNEVSVLGKYLEDRPQSADPNDGKHDVNVTNDIARPIVPVFNQQQYSTSASAPLQPLPDITMTSGKRRHKHRHRHRKSSTMPVGNAEIQIPQIQGASTTFGGGTRISRPATSLSARDYFGKSELVVTHAELQKIVETEPPDDNPDTQDALQSFKKNGRLPMPANKPMVIRKLQRDKVNAILRGNYDNAKEADELSKKVSVSVFEAAEEDRRTNKINFAETKLNEEKKAYSDYKKQCQERIKEEQYQIMEKQKQLDEIHKGEMKLLEEKWNNEGFLRRFSKPSPNLLQIKAIEKSMVIAKMFDNAKTTRNRADQLEKAETRDAQARAESDMKLERDRLLSKQEKEKESLKEKSQQQLNLLKRDLENNERPYKNRIEKLENLIANLKNGTEKREVIPSIFLQSRDINHGELLSPRTALKLSAYKASAQGMKLKIKPLGNISPPPKKGKKSK